jgi:TRAP transporter TAXI family solute receptor
MTASKRKYYIGLTGVAPLVAAALFAFGPTPALSAEGKMPPTILFGTQQPGSLLHTISTGIAKIATKSTGVPVIVRPHSGSSAHLPLLGSGELDLALHPGVIAAMSFWGKERLKVAGVNPLPTATGLRLVMSGSPLLAGIIVRKDSPIKSAADLRGRRVAGGFPSGLGVYINVYAHLRGANMTWKDVKIVPFGNLNDSLNALVQGRVDATVYGIGAPRVREANSKVGVRFVTDDCSAEGKARIRASAPSYFTINLKAGRLPGVVSDICVTSFPLYLMASTKTPNVVVTAVLKGLWENNDELRKLHPGLRFWTRKTAVPKNPAVPYHPAAIAYYKTVGAWTKEAEAAHLKLLAKVR